MNSKLNFLSALEVTNLIQKGEITAVSVLEDSLAQIKRLDGDIKAWVYVSPELARATARSIDEKFKAHKPLGKLAGVPVGVKDIFNTKDMPTQMGSPLWKDFTPGNDARVVHYLRINDAVFPGKTVTAEFAVHAPGPTGNPHNPMYMPGTSSSGSAASVAAYMTPLALGTQTAGSILRPASYCGVYGFKPSFGLIPRTAMLKTTDSLDTVGFFARTVEDLAVMFDVLRVHGPDYPLLHKYLNDQTRQVRGERPWKIAMVNGPKWAHAETYAKKAIYNYVNDLKSESEINIQEIELPSEFARAHEIHSTIYDRTLAYYFRDEFQQHTLISPVMYEIITRGNQISAEQYKQALYDQEKLSYQFDELMKDYDSLLTLTTGGAALEGLDSMDRPDSCLIWTLCGAPAINLPVFVNEQKMPFGAQLVGRRYNDYLLLDLARFLRRRELIPDGTNPVPSLAIDS